MRVSVEYDPDCHRVAVEMYGVDTPTFALESLHQAIRTLAEKEPELIASVAYHKGHLKLETHTDNAGKGLASLYMYLHFQTTHRELSAALWCEILECEEQRQAFREWQQLEWEYGEPGEDHACYFPP